MQLKKPGELRTLRVNSGDSSIKDISTQTDFARKVVSISRKSSNGGGTERVVIFA